MTETTWSDSAQIHPATVRSHRWHLLWIAVILAIGVGFVALGRARVGLGILFIGALLTYAVVRPLTRETLVTSSAGLLRTTGRFVVRVRWEDICCVGPTGSPVETRLTVNFDGGDSSLSRFPHSSSLPGWCRQSRSATSCSWLSAC